LSQRLAQDGPVSRLTSPLAALRIDDLPDVRRVASGLHGSAAIVERRQARTPRSAHYSLEIIMRILMPTFLAALTLAGCVDNDSEELQVDDQASDKADGTQWLKVLTCDGGAAVLDVASQERRQLQFVIRDSNIVNYLASATALPRDMLVNSAGEIILHAWVNNGVFARSDFQSMSVSRLSAYDDALHVDPHVYRDWGGVKALFTMEQADTFSGTCDGGGTTCTPTHWRPAGTPNWFFNSCN
jgi:hypothetical protein